MDAIVTARVPVEIKDQVTTILKEMGSSPTKLINAAYNYVLATHELPTPRTGLEYHSQDQEDAVPAKQVRIVTSQIHRELERSLEATTLQVPQGFWDELGDHDYKDLIAEGRHADYATLG